MPRGKRRIVDDSQENLLDITAKLRTAPCVPALREAVKAWRAGGYKGITETTRLLLNHWFRTDHRLANGRPFGWHPSQRDAIEAVIFVWEFEKVRTRKGLLERYAEDLKNVRLATYDEFARYCIKMATGSGKTKVMSLAVAWQFLNAMREREEIARDYAKTFLLIAPNVIVFERLKIDFAGGRIFQVDPLIPKELKIFWDFDCVMRGEGEKAHAEGTLFLTNIQQFYERGGREDDDEPDAMAGVLGPKPPAQKLEMADFTERIALREGRLLVVNDEAHHTHDEESEWNRVIRGLHARTPLAAQLDFSATPRFQKGALFPWTICDYPLKQAILDGIVKRPMKGVAKIHEAKSDHASVKYRGYLIAGVERWREYRDQLAPLGRKPILFGMLNSTDEADDVGDWLRTKYPEDFGGDKTLVIHTNQTGEVAKRDLEPARRLAREVDLPENPVNALVSVLMLREGWDVQNVTVVVGLRPYAAKANILPEQTIGRGLRLMFRDIPAAYRERVDIIGNKAFLDFVEDLEKLEELQLETFEVGRDKLHIVTIAPQAERAEYDIGLPLLTPALVRRKSLAEQIATLDVQSFSCPVLPLRAGDKAEKTFRYEGFDLLTLQKEIEREYTIPEPQTPQEVIGYYARRIAQEVKLPSQFAVLAPKVRDFFEHKAFGRTVDLEDKATIRAMSTNVAHYVCVQTFRKALLNLTIEEQRPQLLDPARLLSSTPPFPWSRPVWEGRKCVFNLVPCDNAFERAFAKFLDSASDVTAFSKLPEVFGFAIEYTDSDMNLRSYYPDFVAVDESGTRWLLETKGQETAEVERKDEAAQRWCEDASELTNTRWRYLKVPQKQFEQLQAATLADFTMLHV
ncbi:MAG: DEAD/DEAH box helicase family protein [Candidatus Rokubacteria bacterium]|nr:DEAD/DEAH box helicase family protein [Candidatus Rokubacteria bacterium]